MTMKANMSTLLRSLLSMTDDDEGVFKPGDKVPVSGIYSVENDEDHPTHEVTCIAGKPFPPSNKVAHPRYRLEREAIHIEDHEDHKQ